MYEIKSFIISIVSKISSQTNFSLLNVISFRIRTLISKIMVIIHDEHWQSKNRKIEEKTMEEFTINEMKEMQRKLQEKYKEQWEGISPEVGKNKLLWMIGEVGEVIDIVKKQGDRNACQNEAVRKELIEELADVLMYYNDVLLCYDISSEDLKSAYIEKFKKNMKRW